jgi:excisionase family DNA binding protein
LLNSHPLLVPAPTAGAALTGTAPMPKLTDYVRTAEAAELLGVAQNTLRKWAADGVLPVRRNPANGYRLFKRTDLKRFLARIERPTKPR